MRLADMKIRQIYFSEKHYRSVQREHDEVIDFLKTNTFEADSPEEEASLRAEQLQSLLLDKVLACYTAGEKIELLIPLLEELIEKYETWQKSYPFLNRHPKYRRSL